MEMAQPANSGEGESSAVSIGRKGSSGKNNEFVTTGQIAKQTGMTVRTLRYYDQIGLLEPSQYTDGSARMYSKEDLIRLQKIQTLKYIGLSLDEIKNIIRDEALSEAALRSSLAAQKEILYQKHSHMENVIRSINQALDHMDRDHTLHASDWNSLTGLIKAVHSEKDWVEQYHTATRLQTRIHLHDKFSVNPTGWHRWLFGHLQRLQNKPVLKVLELGCGDGTLWSRNIDRIPVSWQITLSDISGGMLDEARRNLGPHKQRFKFLLADVQEIPFHDGQFDLVIASHMLYHVPDIPKAIAEMQRVLAAQGILCVSTMGPLHLQEIERLAAAFDPELRVIDPVVDRFNLENGGGFLSPYFPDVQLHRYEDHLLVREIQPLIDYMTSTPMNARERLIGSAMARFTRYLEEEMAREGPLPITKDTGILVSRKGSQ